MKNPLVISLILPLAHLHGAGLPETIDFNEHVQPILSENCYHCHGPDSSTRAPKSEPLRLDREEFAFLERIGPSSHPPVRKFRHKTGAKIRSMPSSPENIRSWDSIPTNPKTPPASFDA